MIGSPQDALTLLCDGCGRLVGRTRLDGQDPVIDEKAGWVEERCRTTPGSFICARGPGGGSMPMRSIPLACSDACEAKILMDPSGEVYPEELRKREDRILGERR